MGRFDALTQIPDTPKAQTPTPADSPPSISANKPEPQEAIEPPAKPKQKVTERPNDRPLERPNKKRIITRNSFEIFEDQMESLRRISFQDKMDGKLGSMSAMVREAIDNYLLKRSSGK